MDYEERTFREPGDTGATGSGPAAGGAEGAPRQRATDRIREKAAQISREAAERVNVQRNRAASMLDRAAEKLRTTGPRIPGGDKTTQFANRAADRLHSTAGYLREHDAGAMANDVRDAVRRHPAQVLVGALVAGFLVGRAFRGRRY